MALPLLASRIAKEAETGLDALQQADACQKTSAQKRSGEVRKMWQFVHRTWEELEQEQEKKLKSEEVQKRLKETVEKAKTFSHDLLKKLDEDEVVASDFDGRNVTESMSTPVPTKLLHGGGLRPYQHAGLHWLAMMHKKGHNGILADEMGLGKTIMTIALLAHLAEQSHIWGPHLIVVPTSLVWNWFRELQTWLPGFKVILYEGNAKERGIKRRGWTRDGAFNICIASYTVVCKDIRIFKMMKWHYLILDEAQNIKNCRGQKWNFLLPLSTEARLLLTGTPLQNDLMELWSLMHFLMPELFGSRSDFKAWFGDPLEECIANNCGAKEMQEVVSHLHAVLRPFVLRRLKAEVEKQMPTKTEKVIRCQLSRRQRILYDDFLNRREVQKTLGEHRDYLGMMNILMHLRKVCNHPNLFEERKGAQSLLLEADAITYTIPQICLLSVPFRGPALGPLMNLLYYIKTARRSPCMDLPLSVEGNNAHLDKPFTPMSPLPGFQLRNMKTAFRTWEKQQWATSKASFLWRKKQAGIRLLILEAITQEFQIFPELLVPLKHFLCPLQLVECAHLVYFYAPRAVVPMLRQNQYCQDGRFGYFFRAPPFQNWLEDSFMVPFLNELHVRRFQTKASILQRKAQGSQGGMRGDREFMFDARLDPPRRKYDDGVPIVMRKRHIRLVSTGPRDPNHHHGFSVSSSAGAFPDEDMFPLPSPKCSPVQVNFCSSVVTDCGKLQMLASMLVPLHRTKKVLIFTQFTKMLDILEVFMDQRGYSYLRLDGSTKGEDRMKKVDRFNADERIFVFLLSTRAGGLGLNLTGASIVIFFDSDWNPAMDRQAMDRVHRIGQTKNVEIYRLVSEHTVEEHIWRKQLEKRRLDDVVVNQGGFTLEKLRHWTAQDVLQILTGDDEGQVDGAGDNNTKSGGGEGKNSNNNMDDIYKDNVLHGNFEEVTMGQLEDEVLNDEICMGIEDEEDRINYQQEKMRMKNEEAKLMEDIGAVSGEGASTHHSLPPLVKWLLYEGKKSVKRHIGRKSAVRPEHGVISKLPKAKRAKKGGSYSSSGGVGSSSFASAPKRLRGEN